MDPSEPDNKIRIFTETTNKICLCTSISIFLIILFIISPMRHMWVLSFSMKLLIVLLLAYTIYLNVLQTNYLQNITVVDNNEEVKKQVRMNILCSYVFTLFSSLLLFFVLKSFF